MAAFNQHHQQHSFNSNSNSSSSSSSTTSSSHHHVHHPSLPTQTTPQAAAAAPVSRTSPQSHNEPSLLPETIGKRVDPQYSQVLHARVKDILRIHYDSFPGSQPVSFETKHLTELEQEDYFVCEKTDGVRYLLFFCHSSKGPASFLFDRNRIWYYVPNLLFPMRGREKEFLKDTLMDGELVIDTEPNDKKVWRFLLFDLMSLNGVPVTKRSFNTRLGMLQQEVIAPFKNSVRHIADALKSPPFSIELKKMERSYGLHLVFDQMAKLKHSSDGVIWTPVKHPYVPGTCDKLLKWKPPELNTVDFRIFAKWSKEHKPIYNLEVLSHGVTYKFFDHFQPEHELASQWKSHLPDGRIAEFRYDPDWKVTVVEQGYAPTTRKGGWRFVRFRTDKDTANDENVVQKIMHSIQDGITKDQLLAHMDKVRSAWKAREKGLPIPASTSTTATTTATTSTATAASKPTPENLTLSTTATNKPANISTTLSNSSLNTPVSATTPAILPSPSVANASSGSYFPSKEYDYVIRSRNNSIDLGRRQSEPDVSTTTPLSSSSSSSSSRTVPHSSSKSSMKHEPTLDQVVENEEHEDEQQDLEARLKKKEEEEKTNEEDGDTKTPVKVEKIDTKTPVTLKERRKKSTASLNVNDTAAVVGDVAGDGPLQQQNKRDSPKLSTDPMERKRFKSWAGEERRPSIGAPSIDSRTYPQQQQPQPQPQPQSQQSAPPTTTGPTPSTSSLTTVNKSGNNNKSSNNGQPSLLQRQQTEKVKDQQYQQQQRYKNESWMLENTSNNKHQQEEMRRRKISASSDGDDIRRPSYTESSAGDLLYSEKGAKLRKVAVDDHQHPRQHRLGYDEDAQRVTNDSQALPKNGKPWASTSMSASSPSLSSMYGEQHKPTSAPPVVMRKSNSSSIHSLLTTSVEPSSVFKSDKGPSTPTMPSSNSSSASTTVEPIARSAPPPAPREQQQQQHNSAYDFATILRSNDGAHTKQQRLQQQSPPPPPPSSQPPRPSPSQQSHKPPPPPPPPGTATAPPSHSPPQPPPQAQHHHQRPPAQQQQQQQQQQPVHFINYHADGSHIRLAPTEGREWHQHPQLQAPPPQALHSPQQRHQQQQQHHHQQPPMPQQQQQPSYIPPSSTPEQPGGRQLHVWKASDPTPKAQRTPPPPQPQPQPQQQQQQPPSSRDKYYHHHPYGPPPPQQHYQPQPQPMYSSPGYNVHSHHHPHPQQHQQQQQQRVKNVLPPQPVTYHPQHQHLHQHPPPPPPPAATPESQWPRRQSGASSSEAYDDPRLLHHQQHQQQQQQQQQQQRKKSSKAKLDFILN